MRTPLMIGLSGHSLTPDETALLRDVQPAGIILFTRNLASADQTRALTDSLRDLFYDEIIIAIDQEGGRVTRTREFAPALPSAAQIRAKDDFHQAAWSGNFIGEQLALLGINLNFAPVLDIARPDGVFAALPSRCWGTSDQQTIDYAGHFSRWQRKHKVWTCAKHFPSCSRADTDPHHGLPVSSATREDLMASDILPYTALMGDLDAIMTGHVHFEKIDGDQPGLPATLSRRIITDLLRNQLGFDRHLVFTDDLDMGAITEAYPRGEDVCRAIEAGNDIPMICHHLSSIPKAAEAIHKLDGYLLGDIEKRLNRFFKRLKHPPALTEKRWDGLNEKIKKFMEDYPPLDDSSAMSPVETY